MTTTVRRQIYAVLIGALLLAIHVKEADCFTIPSDGVRAFESHESRELASSGEDHLKMVARPQHRPANGQVISKHSDEHDDDSSEFRSVLVGQVARMPLTGTTGQLTGTPKANVRLPISFHSDEQDDFSDEVRSLAGMLAPNARVISATPDAASQPSSGQRIVKRPDERSIVSAQPDKRVIIRTVTTPVNAQTTPMGKAIFRHSDEHDDYSDEIASKVFASANPPVKSVPARTASPAVLGQTANGQHPIYRLRSGGHVDLPWMEHGDDIHVQIDPITKQVVNIRAEQKDSLEHDDLFSDEVIRSHLAISHTPTLKSSPAQLNAEIQRATGQILNQQIGQVRPAVPGPAQPIRDHVIRHSDEIDDISLEDLHARSAMQTQTSATGGSLVAPTSEGNRFRDSDEHDVSLEDVIAAHSRLQNGQGQRAPVQQGVRPFGDSDERDSSSEVARRILNQQNGQNLTTANQVVHLVHDSDEDDDTSVEMILNIRNGTASGKGTLLIKQSGKVIGIDRNPRTGQNPTAPAQQGVHFISRHSDEHDDSIEIVGLVRKTAVIPPETTIVGGHAIRHSDEIDDDSLELHHIGHQLPSAITTPDVQHHFRHSDEDNVFLKDFIGISNRPMNGQIQVAPVQRGGHLLRDSDEHDDLSLEVNFSLLPEIQRLFTDVRTDTVLMPAVQDQGVAAVGGSPGNPAVRKAKELEIQFELEDILADPLFKQKIQEIDDRLKSAPDARGKRLIEKYAEALALTSPSFNAAPPIIKSSFCLPFLFTCLLVWFS